MYPGSNIGSFFQAAHSPRGWLDRKRSSHFKSRNVTTKHTPVVLKAGPVLKTGVGRF